MSQPPYHAAGDETTEQFDPPFDAELEAAAALGTPPPEPPRPAARTATGRGLLVASTLMAAGTLISRVLGLVRQSLQFAALGGKVKGDIFMMATTLPNQVYNLIAGGTLNAILVPLIVRATKEDDDEGESYINRIVTLFLVMMAATTLLCLVGTPLLLHINNPIWFDAQHHAELQSLTLLTYLTMPQIFFFGVYYVAGQVLNARERFGPFTWAPIANNAIAILTFVLYVVVYGTRGDPNAPYTTDQLMVLGIGSTLGIAAQALCTMVFLRAAHIHYRPRFDFRGTGLGRTFHVAKWVILTVVVGFVATTLVHMIANGATLKSDRGAGQAILDQANLIWMMPHGLITVSVTTALLPAIAAAFTDRDLGRVRGETMRAIKLTNAAMVPIAVALVVFAMPIAQLIFGYGQGHDSVAAMGWTLIGYSVGLPVFTLSFVLQRTLYALEDTRATLVVNIVFAAAWVLFGLLLVTLIPAPEWTAPCLALAYALAGVPEVAMNVWLLRTRVPDLPILAALRHQGQALLATVPAAVVGWGIMHLTLGPRTGKPVTLVMLAVAGTVALVMYWVAARLLGIQEVNDAAALITRRLRRRSTPVEAADPAPAPTPDEQPTELFDREAPEDPAIPPASADPFDAEPDEDPAICDAVDPDPDPDLPPAAVGSGDVLGERYRLTRFVVQRGSTVTWEAQDEALSRPVLVHVLAPGDPRSGEILAAARRGSAATDSRFLRVLDAVHSADPDVGSYLVCEFVQGQSLEAVLAHGPLSALEAGWVVRELADALATMHADNLFHGRLNPDTVIITSAGNVKIVGFGTEAVLYPRPDDDQLTDLDWASADVEALGKLLYACLVTRWPGGGRYGMEAAPRQGGQWLSPGQVRAGISPALDQICDQILARPPRGGLPPLRSATDVMVALSRVLGSAEASGDLERRLAAPVSVRSAVSAATPPTPQVTAPVTAVPPPPSPVEVTGATAARPRRRRTGLLLLVGLLLAALVVGVGMTFAQLQRHPGAPAPINPASSAPAPVTVPIVAAKDYDPEGSLVETPGEVKFAYDGNPKTAWHTEPYTSPTLGNNVNHKTGVGIYVDLGKPTKVRRVVVTTQGTTGLQVRVPGDAGGVPAASAGWRTVGAAAHADGRTEIPLDGAGDARYVLIWLTELPQTPSGSYQGAVAEIEVQA